MVSGHNSNRVAHSILIKPCPVDVVITMKEKRVIHQGVTIHFEWSVVQFPFGHGIALAIRDNNGVGNAVKRSCRDGAFNLRKARKLGDIKKRLGGLYVALTICRNIDVEIERFSRITGCDLLVPVFMGR